MFNFLKSTSQKEVEKQIRAAQESIVNLSRSAFQLAASLRMIPIKRTQDFCYDFLSHLIDWRKYSLSEDEIGKIHLRLADVECSKEDLQEILNILRAFEYDEATILSSLDELRKRTEDQKAFCQELIERLKVQNPLMNMFFADII
ncbi:MAG: hypothetical protein WA064_03740 [Candidatus Moraniibacteriota bacterium]